VSRVSSSLRLISLSLFHFSHSLPFEMDNTNQEDEDFSQSIAWDTNPPQPVAPSTSSPYSAYTTAPTPTTTQQPTTTQRVSSASVKDGKIELEGTSDMFVSYLVTAIVRSLSLPLPSPHSLCRSRRIYHNSIRKPLHQEEGFKISYS